MRLQFINVLYSVNIYRGASGPRPISPVVQEVLSELKSMSTAKGEKSFFTASKKNGGAFRQCSELAFPVD